MRYHVYLWPDEASVEAVMAAVDAPDTEHALLLAMEQCGLTSASSAWIVSPDDDSFDARAEDILLLTFEEFDAFLRWCQLHGQDEVLHVE